MAKAINNIFIVITGLAASYIDNTVPSENTTRLGHCMMNHPAIINTNCNETVFFYVSGVRIP